MEIEQVQTIYGPFLCWKDDLFARQLKAYSAHTRNEIAMVRNFISPGDLVIDVGAHIGTFAIPLARFTGSTGKVLAFEANPDNFALLERNVALNALEGTIETVHAVVADAEGPFEWKMPAGGNSGMSYFQAATCANGNIPGISLDPWLETRFKGVRPGLIKIDVEGAELCVLRSCLRTVQSQLPTLYIEICPDSLQRFHSDVEEVDQLLRQLGYAFFRNVGQRNSSNDDFRLVGLESLAQGGPFFDLLAVHPSSTQAMETATALAGGEA